MEERLQKILAQAGVAARRKCEELIRAGRVSVNGEIVTELGTKVDPERARILVDGKPIHVEQKTYIVLHKPRGYLSDIDEMRGKPLAVDLVPSTERLYAAGRLDVNSEGLLLLTNDGEFAHRITHPRFEHEKEYLVLIAGEPDQALFAKFLKGIWYEGERLKAIRVERAARQQRFGTAERGQAWIKITLREGKKRQIRNMCGIAGHPALRLIRTRIGEIDLGSLPPGKWRELTAREVQILQTSLLARKK